MFVIVVTSLECDPIVYGPFDTEGEAQQTVPRVWERIGPDADEGDGWEVQVCRVGMRQL